MQQSYKIITFILCLTFCLPMLGAAASAVERLNAVSALERLNAVRREINGFLIDKNNIMNTAKLRDPFVEEKWQECLAIDRIATPSERIKTNRIMIKIAQLTGKDLPKDFWSRGPHISAVYHKPSR